MMNDRFDAQLREHLLATADTKPGDGQLAAVLRSVAGTAQRHPLAARLTWFPGRVGPIPTRTLRFGLVAAALVGTMLAASLYVGGGPVPQATPSPSPSAPIASAGECVAVEPGEAYGQRVGSLFVTLTAPFDRSIAWEGRTDTFDLSGSCLSDTPVDVRINIVTTVYRDACDRTSGVAVAGYADAVQKFSAQRGRTNLELPGHSDTVGGYPAAWFHIEPGAGCDALQLWNGVDISDGDVLAYLLDVDGVTLGMALWFRDDSNLNGSIRDRAETMIYGIDITSGLAPAATDPVAIPECTQFNSDGTYTRGLGGLSVGVTAPGTPSEPWSGARDEWNLRKARCDGPGMPLISATLVSHVYVDACQWEDGSVPTPTATEAVAALQAQTGHDTSAPVAMTLGGHAATRLDISLAAGFDRQACDAGNDLFAYARMWDDQIIVAGSVQQVYVVDVDVTGRVLVINAGYFPYEIPAADLEQIDQILATLRIGP